MSQSFIKKQENFTCDQCGYKVVGNGYTNHCPVCLYSKHVDIFPGDRKSECRGLMEPIGIEKKNRELRIVHRCLKCGYIGMVKITEEDNEELIIELSSNPV